MYYNKLTNKKNNFTITTFSMFNNMDTTTYISKINPEPKEELLTDNSCFILTLQKHKSTKTYDVSLIYLLNRIEVTDIDYEVLIDNTKLFYTNTNINAIDTMKILKSLYTEKITLLPPYSDYTEGTTTVLSSSYYAYSDKETLLQNLIELSIVKEMIFKLLNSSDELNEIKELVEENDRIIKLNEFNLKINDEYDDKKVTVTLSEMNNNYNLNIYSSDLKTNIHISGKSDIIDTIRQIVINNKINNDNGTVFKISKTDKRSTETLKFYNFLFQIIDQILNDKGDNNG